MVEKINAIIDEWDPLGLFPFAPKDEYSDESLLIYQAYQENKSVRALAQAIHQIFSTSFGEDVFTTSIDECIKIADTIAKNI